jgi:hypothetical protein
MGRLLVTHNYYLNVNEANLYHLCIYPVYRLSCLILFELLIALLSKWASLLAYFEMKND